MQTITSWPKHEAVGNQTGPSTVGDQGVVDEWARWAEAVNRMAAGDYAGAWLCFAELVASDNSEIAGLSSAARASGLRQLGAHAEAVEHDDRAISTRGIGVLDGLIGRAADEIGLGQPDRCRHYLARANQMLAQTPEQRSRGRTRIGWVTAEVALVRGEPAVAPAQSALDAARDLKSPRHILKSRLIRGVALREAGDPAGDAELLAVLHGAADLGIRTLVWPAALALDGRLPEDLRYRAAEAVAYIRTRVPRGRFDSWVAGTDRLSVGL